MADDTRTARLAHSHRRYLRARRAVRVSSAMWIPS